MNELEKYLFPNGFETIRDTKKTRVELWLDICSISLDGSKLIDTDDLELILDELVKENFDLSNVILKNDIILTDNVKSDILNKIK